jgi:hypothetical protein
MLTALLLASGVGWTATYVLIIAKGFADRTYGMPIVALCANLSWEFIFSFVRPHTGAQRIVDVVWLCLDLVIAYTALRFGPREFPYLRRALCYACFGGTLVLAYLGVDLVSREFDHGRGTYAAFGQNLMMSGLFLAMLASRRGLRGQSPWIAAAKLVGTAFASVAIWGYGNHQGSLLLPYLYVGNAVLDAAYLAAVVAVSRRPATDEFRAPAESVPA